MTNEEMQVLRALERGLEHAEYSVSQAEDPAKWLLRDVQAIKDAIEVVKRWETKE